jgi:hypothetical protein
LQAGSATFYVTEPAALAAARQLLRRLKAAGALPVVLAKVLHDAEQLQLAVRLDPQHPTRNIKAQQCVHMFNAYSEHAAGSLTYLHQVRRCWQHIFAFMFEVGFSPPISMAASPVWWRGVLCNHGWAALVQH